MLESKIKSRIPNTENGHRKKEGMKERKEKSRKTRFSLLIMSINHRSACFLLEL